MLAVWALGATTSVCSAQIDCLHKQVFNDDDDSCLDQAPSPQLPVVAAILKTKDAQESFAEMEPADRTTVSKLLQGLPVHLRNRKQEDMIVRGKFPLSGGDNTWFWIVISVDSHPSAFLVQGSRVTVLKTRHNGYADIRTDWYAASYKIADTFRYDGKHYKRVQESYENLPPA